MKKFSASELSLSALSCALVVIFLTVGSYSEILLFTGYLFAGIALMLPLSTGSVKGFFSAYMGGGILGFIFNSARMLDLLPYVVFFGLHPLVNELQLKRKVTKLNTWVACFLKALWFDLTMYGIWWLLFGGETTFAVVDKFIIPILLTFGTAFFVFYDYTMYKCRATVNTYARKIFRNDKK